MGMNNDFYLIGNKQAKESLDFSKEVLLHEDKSVNNVHSELQEEFKRKKAR